MKRFVGIAFLILVVFTMSVGAEGGCGSSSDADSSDETLFVDDVYDACKAYIEDGYLLHAGSSDFEGIDEAQIVIEGHSASEVSYVDAANGFGAQTRYEFQCHAEYSDGYWSVDEVVGL
jgi:hypothetical protein